MDAQAREEDARALITSCSFSMRMQMAESARKQVGTRATDSSWWSLSPAPLKKLMLRGDGVVPISFLYKKVSYFALTFAN